MKTTEASRKRLRSIAHRLTREGDDHTMSGTFGQYNEGESVTAALDDLEACLAFIREVAEGHASRDPLEAVRVVNKALALLAAEASR